MTKFVECTELASGQGININFDNVEAFETVEQSGRAGTKISFVGGRYVLVEQTTKQLSDTVNVRPS